jgi:acetyl esterase
MSANVGDNASPFVDQLADGPGVPRIDPTDPAAPMYRLLALMRSPLTLRDLMLKPVPIGYIGQEKPIDPAELPKSRRRPLSRHPRVRAGYPLPVGRIRCQVFSPPGAAARRAMMLYAHGGGSHSGSRRTPPRSRAGLRRKTGWWWLASTTDSRPSGRSRRVSMIASSYCNGCKRTERRSAATERASRWGESAGGNIAAALPLKARDASLSVPRAALLLAPISDFFFEQYESFERLAPLGIVYDTASSGSSAAPIWSTAGIRHIRTPVRRVPICTDIPPRSSPPARLIRSSTTTAPSRKAARGGWSGSGASRPRWDAARILFFSRNVQAGRPSFCGDRGISQAHRFGSTHPLFAPVSKVCDRWTAPADGLHSRCVPTI